MAVELASVDAVEVLKWTWGIGVPALAWKIVRRVEADISANAAAVKAALEKLSVLEALTAAVAEVRDDLRSHKHAYNNHLQGLPSAYASSQRLERLEEQTREDVRALHTKIEESAKEIRGSITESNREASDRHTALVALISKSKD